MNDPAIAPWVWPALAAVVFLLGGLLVGLNHWLSWRNLHTRPVVWNFKRGWYPWWLNRQG